MGFAVEVERMEERFGPVAWAAVTCVPLLVWHDEMIDVLYKDSRGRTVVYVW